MNMRKQKGFSLIELLIVVAIILIIAAIAIPNLLRSRIAANESAAAATTRTLNTTEVTYSTTYPAAGYAATLAILGPGATDCSAPTSAAARARKMNSAALDIKKICWLSADSDSVAARSAGNFRRASLRASAVLIPLASG